MSQRAAFSWSMPSPVRGAASSSVGALGSSVLSLAYCNISSASLRICLYAASILLRTRMNWEQNKSLLEIILTINDKADRARVQFEFSN